MTLPSCRRWRWSLLAIIPAALLASCRGVTEPEPDPDPDPDPGVLVSPTPFRMVMGHRPYGIAASTAGAVFVSRLDAHNTTRIDPATLTSGAEIPVGLTPTDVAINPAGTRAYIANQFSQSVTVINTATNAVVTTFPVTGDPFKVAVSPDGSTLYVGTNAGRAYKLNAVTGAVLGSVVTSSSPFGFAFGTGTTMYVSTWAGGTVLEVDTQTMTITRTFTTGGIAQELAISPDRSELYVANEGLNRVEVWNLRAGTRTANIDVEGGAFGLIMEPDGSHLWVSLSQSGRVALINRATRTVQKTYDLEGIPRRIAYDAQDDVIVVTNEWGWLDIFSLDPNAGPPPLPARLSLSSRPYGIAGTAQGAVFVSRLDNSLTTRIDPATRTRGANIQVGVLPTDIAVNPAGTRAYVANQGSQSVSVIDVSSNSVVATFGVTGDPFKVAVSPDGTALYVGTNAGRAYKLDAATGASLGSVATGATPFGFAFGAANMMYISTWNAGTVLEVNSQTMTTARTFTTGGIAQELAISADRSELYLANELLDQVEVWNIGTGTRTATIAVPGGPFGLILEPDGSHLWASLSQEGRVVLINRATRAVVNTFPVGGIPRRIAYHAAGQNVIVTNEGGWLDFIPSP